MVLPCVHIATAVIALNAVASFSAPIIRRGDPISPMTGSPSRREGDESPTPGWPRRTRSSVNQYFSAAGSDFHGSPSSLASGSSRSLYPPSSIYSPHSQLSDSPHSHDGPSSPLWEDMRTQSSNSAHGGSFGRGTWSPFPQSPPPDASPAKKSTWKFGSGSKKLFSKNNIKAASLGVGLAAVFTGIGYTASLNSRRDVDELEDSLDAREPMVDLDKLD